MVFLIVVGSLVVLWLLLEWRQHRKGRGRLVFRRDNLPKTPYVGENYNHGSSFGASGGGSY